MKMTIKIRKLCDALGAEVLDINPAEPLDAETFAELRNIWLDYSVLLFRGVDWTPAQHIEFTRGFGELHIMPRLGTEVPVNLQQHPEIFVVSNVEQDGKPVGVKRAGWGWHSDGEDKQYPNMGSMLYGVKTPKVGGDTGFASTYRAFEALPQETKDLIIGKRARFSRVEKHLINYPNLPPLTEQEKLERPDVWHPIVRTHPETGRRCLYIGRWAVEIEGIPKEEGDALIEELTTHITKPEFTYIHNWQPGDVVFWDNRSTQHCAIPYDDSLEERHMLRTTLEGDVPFFQAEGGVKVESSLVQAH
jgi:taurine dioxygenase